MNSSYDTTLLQWLDLEADGALSDDLRAMLGEQLEARAYLRQEARQLADLHRLLDAGRIPLRPGFAARVMAALPAAAPRQMRRVERGLPLAGSPYLPLVLAVSLALLAGLALATAGRVDAGVLPTLAAIADFFATTALAGAGLLGATWQGVTLAFDALLVDSKTSLAALVVTVLCLDLLFLRLLRRPPRAPAPAERPDAAD